MSSEKHCAVGDALVITKTDDITVSIIDSFISIINYVNFIILKLNKIISN